ncbi:MAG: TlpA family protein disulfide reductase [Gordonia polyisoprenivorans]|nr:TlpA family protein disulfide reductase [Gordonia polyisoprenivorans]
MSDQALVSVRDAARSPLCGTTRSAAPTVRSRLNDVVMDCVAGGPPVDLAQVSGGLPAAVDYWAHWCVSCRKELPVFADFAARAGHRVQVVTVQSVEGAGRPDPSLSLVAEIGVHLHTLVDAQGRFAAAAALQRVYPSTVLVRGDGTVAAVMPRVEEMAQTAAHYLGVQT